MNKSKMQQLVSLGLATLVIVTFIVLIFYPRQFNQQTLAIIRFLAAIAGALSSYYFIGNLHLEGKLPFTNLQIKGVGAFAIFLLILLLFYWGIDKSGISNIVSDQNQTPSVEANPEPSGKSNLEPSDKVYHKIYTCKPSSRNPAKLRNLTLVSKFKDKPILPEAIEKENLMFILDASGSMADDDEKLSGEKVSRLVAAKETIAKKIKDTTSEGVWNVGLSVFGGDCESLRFLIPPGTKSFRQINTELDKVTPEGGTPIGYSLKATAKAIKNQQIKTTIVLLTDGGETCDDNLIETVKLLKKDGFNFAVNVVGYAISEADKKQLEALATTSGGSYYSASNSDDLDDKLNQAIPGSFIVQKPKAGEVDKWKIFESGEFHKDNSEYISKSRSKTLWDSQSQYSGKYDFCLEFKDKTIPAIIGEIEIKGGKLVTITTDR